MNIALFQVVIPPINDAPFITYFNVIQLFFINEKCRELYFSIKEAMEKAVSRLNDAIGTTANLPNLSELGGEFQILDLKTNIHGTLEICMEGIGLVFNDEKVKQSIKIVLPKCKFIIKYLF
jgi:hypothetical protein